MFLSAKIQKTFGMARGCSNFFYKKKGIPTFSGYPLWLFFKIYSTISFFVMSPCVVWATTMYIPFGQSLTEKPAE